MYRTESRPHEEPASRVSDRATKTVIKVSNGIVSRMAFPCFYAYRADGKPFPPNHRMPPIWQDHLGWPSPDHPDRSFQPRVIEGLMIEPIHLESEGYTDATVALKDAPDGLSVSAFLDDSIVRIAIETMCDDADSAEVEVPFALYVSGTLVVDEEEHAARDLVTRGVIRILPAVHSTTETEGE